ncbi:MAG TPA: hypothetical protein VMJ34_01315 [Bryobacteraceae bacterium]|nr:hypothetical protein [Bryobacteraceae bacterium]
MTRALLLVGLLFSMANTLVAGETSFPKTKLADVKGKQADANLTFNGTSKSIVVDVTGRNIATFPYDKIDKMSYEYAKHHRIKQGAIVMVASLGAGAIVMLTSSKSHWFTFEYHEGEIPKTLVLRLDKGDYKQVILTAEQEIGKKVELISKVKFDKEKKDKK